MNPSRPTKGVDKLNRGAEFREGRNAQHSGVIEVEHAFVGVLGEQRVEHGAGLVAVFAEHVPFLDVSRRARAGSVVWHRTRHGQIRSKGSRSLFSSAAITPRSKPSASNSSIIACLRRVLSQRFRKASRLAKRFLSALLVKSRRELRDELAFFVQVFHPLGDDGCFDAVHIDLAPPRPIGWQGDVGGINDDRSVFARLRRGRFFTVIRWWMIVGRGDGIVFAGFVNLDWLAVRTPDRRNGWSRPGNPST